MLRPFITTAQALFVLFFLLNLSLAAPTQSTELTGHGLSRRADKPSQGQIDAANGMFPGIDWNYSAEQGGCDSGQFAILVESTRMALELMQFSGSLLQYAFETTGFHQYFMRHAEWENHRDFNLAHGKYVSVLNWPRTQPKKNTRDWKTAYWCTEPVWMRNHCASANKPPAYTPPAKRNTAGPDPTYPYANSVVFCPRFWTKEFQYVNFLTEKQDRELADIDDLHSYEHVLIHEWFHNYKTDPADTFHVTDIVGDYGDGKRGGGVGDIEVLTVRNADSWAWMFSYNWFKSIYSWKDDGSMKPADQQEDQPGDQQQDQLKARDDEDPEAVEDPYKDVPIDPDTEDESTMTTEFPWPKAYNMENHPRSLITAGGCFVVEECRYPQADGTVDPDCRFCTCDVSKDDSGLSTEEVPLEDERCAG